MKTSFAVLLVGVCMGIASSVVAAPVSILVGDKDGFGPVGCANTSGPGTCVWPGLGASGTGYDGRSAGEAAASDGSQFTDVYSSIFPGFGPNPSSGDVIMSFVGTLTSATIDFATGDFQTSSFGPIGVSINGTAVPFSFDDGFQATAIHSIVLSAAELAAANLAGMVVIHLDHLSSADFIAFDYFELNGDLVAAAPEPATLLLFAIGLLGLAVSRGRAAV